MRWLRKGRKPIELPEFRNGLKELEKPLDLWRYFLQNGEKLDADALPGTLDIPETRWAMEPVKMLPQNDPARALHAGPLKAKRGVQTLETLRDQWQHRYLEAAPERDEARKMAVRKIQLCQRLLRRPVSDCEDLQPGRIRRPCRPPGTGSDRRALMLGRALRVRGAATRERTNRWGS